MNSRRITITDPEGIHLRVAAEIARISAKDDDTTVVIENIGKGSADGRSIIELLLLDAESGSKIQLKTDGPHENTIMACLCEFFEGGLGI